MTIDQQIRDILNHKETRRRALSYDDLSQVMHRLREGYFALNVPALSSEQQALLRRVAIPRDKLRPLCAAYILSFRQAPEVAKAIDVSDTLLPDILDKDQQFTRLNALTGTMLRVVKDHKLLLSYQLAETVERVEEAFQQMLAAAPDEDKRVRMNGAYSDLQAQGQSQTERLMAQRRTNERRGHADKDTLESLKERKVRDARRQRLLALAHKSSVQAG